MAEKMKRCSSCGEVKPATGEFYYHSKRPGDQGFRARCKVCEAKARGKAPKESPKPESPQGTLTNVKCACGHNYMFNIKRPEMVEYLKNKKCPPCQANLYENKKEDETPKQAPTPKPEAKKVDKAWVDSVMKLVPAALFHSVLPELILAVRAGLAIWLQGPPGTSKSTLAEQVANGLGMNYYYLPCHEFMTRSDLFGFTDANGIDHRTPLWDAFENGGILLLDEVDNGNPNLLAALNGALSNSFAVFGSGTMVKKHDDFRVIATANTAGLGPEHGFIGRNGVDLATRDRFVTMHVLIDDVLETALAVMYSGESVQALIPEFTESARKSLEKRSRNRETLSPSDVLDAVRRVRAIVDARFRGMVVSPRATIHVAAMVAAGFTLEEGLKAKLPGMKPAEVTSVLKEANI